MEEALDLSSDRILNDESEIRVLYFTKISIPKFYSNLRYAETVCRHFVSCLLSYFLCHKMKYMGLQLCKVQILNLSSFRGLRSIYCRKHTKFPATDMSSEPDSTHLGITSRPQPRRTTVGITVLRLYNVYFWRGGANLPTVRKNIIPA